MPSQYTNYNRSFHYLLTPSKHITSLDFVEIKRHKCQMIKPKFHLARLVSTRHDTFDVSSPRILAVSSLSNSTARHARHDVLDTSNVSCRVETWRDEPSWIWAVLHSINVKKLHFIHMLTATDDRSSHTKNSKNKKKSYITITLHIVIRQCAAV